MQLKQSSVGQKIFRQEDIDRILLIKHLRQQEKLTLTGIKQRINEMNKIKTKGQDKNRQNLLWIQKELLKLKTCLQNLTTNEK